MTSKPRIYMLAFIGVCYLLLHRLEVVKTTLKAVRDKVQEESPDTM
jgi:hypothetical protein